MREILFRGKLKGENEWITGNLLFYSDVNRAYISLGVFKGGSFLEVQKDTVGQYTGLTDKNGKKIFEGDIVRCKYANAPNNEHIQKVVFFEGKFMAEFLNGGCYAELYDGARHFNFDKSVYMIEFEVIGNIHDNPDLLKEGADNE